MLKTMRQNTKVILWIIIIAFVGTIIFAWGMNVTGMKKRQRETVGVVNGQKISFRLFHSTLQKMHTQARERSGQELDAEASRRLRDEIWNEMVKQILLAEEVEKRKLQATDEELLYYIQHNPPPFILNNESLQTDGKFDPQKYAAVLADPRYDWTFLENQYRAMIPLQKLQSMIAATVRVTDAEVLNEYKANNERVQTRYVAFLPKNFEVNQAEVTGEQIGQYFNEHREDYHQPRKTNLNYVFLEKIPTQADEDSSRADIETIRERIMMGEDFAETFGWHIIKLEERRGQGSKEEVHARHILLEVRPSYETLQALIAQVKDLVEKANEIGLEEAAQAADLVVKQTGLFPEGGRFVPGLGKVNRASRFAFSEKPGKIGGPFENESGFYVISIREQRKSGVPLLEEIKAQVKSDLVRQMQKQLALEKATDFGYRLRENLTLAEGAQEASLSVEETKPFARQDYVPNIGLANEFVGKAFGLPEGETSGLVETNRGYYFLQVVAREDIERDQYEEQKETLKLDLLRRKQNQAFGDWFEGIMKQAKIEDHRSYFYEG
jgi:peptidyl-prolyl cis-trans isomerase D